ncbi:MAG: hypothetical protein UT66_C0008G0012 [candidate division CPR2 bacterium GW2011_GWC1_39_9]|uniref:Prepilin-type N-terminal cleavage/methylation domain-containing protein n=1 Tax=candidate division CPR2 bacterium GW2011_GWC2_39_10 TaxID=1618345 RepID=A0A0G0PAL9_UNCC2|nr:MAG: hypothetical protein UT18_C0003G0023 [candidate division CPR2 bacterium GW2011_GWC2_39_10]KKR35670.1 MAG: hypothetical protein UT66_C0008G0012 [candidate division CPR2 bacterium GW2011_GWC1_39_9]
MNKNIRGLTILEVVIATSILGITLASTIMVMSRIAGFGSGNEARSLSINYAQEAVDAIKNIRDNEYCMFFNADAGTKYENGYFDLTRDATTNQWALTRINPQPAAANAFRDIQGMDGADNRMRQAVGMDTPNTTGRRINIDSITGGRRITIDISWKPKGMPQQTYTTVSDIYKWKYYDQ